MGSILGQNINVDNKDNVLNLTMRRFGTIGFAGCTANVSLTPGEQSNSFYITNFNHGDLLAIVLCHYNDEGPNQFSPYIVEIEKKDGKAFIDLEKPESEKKWMPRPDRLIQIIEDGYVRVMVNNEWFSNSKYDKEKGCRILPASAGNLMVKYAYGLAEAKEIIDLAEEIQMQADAVEMLEIEKSKNAQLHQQIRECENQVDDFMRGNAKIASMLGYIHLRINAIEDEVERFFTNKEKILISAADVKSKILTMDTVLR